MRRRLIVGIATVVLSIAGSTLAVAASSPRAANGNGYVLTDIADVPGAVDIVERSPSDQFLYVVSRKGTIERISSSGKRLDRVLDVSALTTPEGER
ncbi:MAG: hypothetical protein RL573_1279, partial [Actinomycetota bacterium]